MRTQFMTRRKFIASAIALGATGVGFALRRKLSARVASITQLPSFAAGPPLVPHDPARDRAKIHVAQGGYPAANVDTVLSKLGGIRTIVGEGDVVIVKVSAQWWNQGMT